MQAVLLIVYTVLAFVPFAAFIYPGLKAERRRASLCSAVLEGLVLIAFAWNFVCIILD
jgi:hypothetical protein